jgi:hypothetical protein
MRVQRSEVSPFGENDGWQQPGLLGARTYNSGQCWFGTSCVSIEAAMNPPEDIGFLRVDGDVTRSCDC